MKLMKLLNSYIYLCALLCFCVMPVIADEQLNKAEQRPAETQYSEAQKLLFSTPHLSNVESAAVLYYDFSQHGSQTRNFDDEITLTITNILEDGGKDVNVSFLSGENNRPYSDIKGFHSNPLIMFFLQWDVEKMDSGSKVTHHYFRHLLRQAFLTDADSKEIELDFAGRKVKAHKIFFQPLLEQKADALYQSYPSKQYEFIISDAVPGGIYSIATLIPSAASGENSTTSATSIEHTLIQFSRSDEIK